MHDAGANAFAEKTGGNFLAARASAHPRTAPRRPVRCHQMWMRRQARARARSRRNRQRCDARFTAARSLIESAFRLQCIDSSRKNFRSAPRRGIFRALFCRPRARWIRPRRMPPRRANGSCGTPLIVSCAAIWRRTEAPSRSGCGIKSGTAKPVARPSVRGSKSAARVRGGRKNGAPMRHRARRKWHRGTTPRRLFRRRRRVRNACRRARDDAHRALKIILRERVLAHLESVGIFPQFVDAPNSRTHTGAI